MGRSGVETRTWGGVVVSCKGRGGKYGEEKKKSRTGERERTGSDSTKDHSTGIVKTLDSPHKD